MSGTCLATTALSPATKIIGAEPEMADDAFRSLAAGKFIPQTNPNTIADGLRTSMGVLTWPIIRDHVQEIVTISESEIVDLMKLFFERTKLLIEPSCTVAVGAAALQKSTLLKPGDRVGVIITGGNVDLSSLPF